MLSLQTECYYFINEFLFVKKMLHNTYNYRVILKNIN